MASSRTYSNPTQNESEWATNLVSLYTVLLLTEAPWAASNILAINIYSLFSSHSHVPLTEHLCAGHPVFSLVFPVLHEPWRSVPSVGGWILTTNSTKRLKEIGSIFQTLHWPRSRSPRNPSGMDSVKSSQSQYVTDLTSSNDSCILTSLRLFSTSCSGTLALREWKYRKLCHSMMRCYSSSSMLARDHSFTPVSLRTTSG